MRHSGVEFTEPTFQTKEALLSARAEAIITAGLRPELFADRGVLSRSKTLAFAALAILILAGFTFRLSGLNAEGRSEEHTSELQSHLNLVCRLLLEKKKK